HAGRSQASLGQLRLVDVDLAGEADREVRRLILLDLGAGRRAERDLVILGVAREALDVAGRRVRNLEEVLLLPTGPGGVGDVGLIVGLARRSGRRRKGARDTRALNHVLGRGLENRVVACGLTHREAQAPAPDAQVLVLDAGVVGGAALRIGLGLVRAIRGVRRVLRLNPDDAVEHEVALSGGAEGASGLEAEERRLEVLRRHATALVIGDDDERLERVGTQPTLPIIVPVDGDLEGGVAGDGGVEMLEALGVRGLRGNRGTAGPGERRLDADVLAGALAVAGDQDHPVVDAALLEDVSEVLVDVPLDALDLVAHASRVVDDDDDVDRLRGEGGLLADLVTGFIWREGRISGLGATITT